MHHCFTWVFPQKTTGSSVARSPLGFHMTKNLDDQQPGVDGNMTPVRVAMVANSGYGLWFPSLNGEVQVQCLNWSSSIFGHGWMGIGQRSWPLDLVSDPKNMAHHGPFHALRGTRLVKRRWTQPCGTPNAAVALALTPTGSPGRCRGWDRTLGFFAVSTVYRLVSFDVSRLVC